MAAQGADRTMFIGRPTGMPASNHLLKDPIQFKKICTPLYNATVEGNWKEAKRIIRSDISTVQAAITRGSLYTVLHVASSQGHVHFVRELLKWVDENVLYLLDQEGNIPFFLAVKAGKVPVAVDMIQKNPIILQFQSAEGMSPLRFATYHKCGEMALFLYPRSISFLVEKERVEVFFDCIKSNDPYLLDLALIELDYICTQGVVQAAHHNLLVTAFDALAKNHSAFISAGVFERLRYAWTNKGNQLKSKGIELLKGLLKIISGIYDQEKVKEIVTRALFLAAESGNDDFITQLSAHDPAFLLIRDSCNRTFWHIAAIYKKISIFKPVLVNKLGPQKYSTLCSKDCNGNTIQHLAALPSSIQYDEISGPDLRLNQDKKFFEKVRKVIPAECESMKNKKGEKPKDTFVKEHELFKYHEPTPWYTMFAVAGSSAGIVALCFMVVTYLLKYDPRK